MKKEKLLNSLIYVFVFFILVFLGMYLSRLTDVKSINVTGIDYASENEIIVEVKGEVQSPGKYSVPAGTPVHDVIYMADGLTNDGDPKSVDMSQLLINPCTVTIAKTQNCEIEAVSSKVFSPENKCDINTATLSDLEALPGIGESLAFDIINYRKINGRFNTIEEIKNVKGIGDKKYEKFKDLIKVGG